MDCKKPDVFFICKQNGHDVLVNSRYVVKMDMPKDDPDTWVITDIHDETYRPKFNADGDIETAQLF